MGRPKKYNTEEERLAADRADKRRWYQKVKEEKKQVFRLRALHTHTHTHYACLRCALRAPLRLRWSSWLVCSTGCAVVRTVGKNNKLIKVICLI